MKEFTAKYDTKTMTGVEYSFNAESREEAIAFARRKFTAFPEVEIYEDTGSRISCDGELFFKGGEIVENK